LAELNLATSYRLVAPGASARQLVLKVATDARTFDLLSNLRLASRSFAFG